MIENDLKDFIIANKVIRSYKGTKSRVVIPNGIIGIGPGAFYQNDNITSVIMSESVISVSRKAFSLCSNLKSVRFSKNIKRIGADAFSFCMGLTNITLYPGVEIVRPRAFSGCHGIKNIYLPESLKEIGKDSFVKYTADCTIHAPLNSKAQEYAIANNILVDQKNPPKKQYEPVLPNENNYKDPKAIRFFKTGNYGIDDDDEVLEGENLNDNEALSNTGNSSDAFRVGNSVELGSSVIEDEDLDDEDEEDPVEEKEEEQSEDSKDDKAPKKEEKKRKGKSKKNEQLVEVIIRSLLCILAVGILVLAVLFTINYKNNRDGFIESRRTEDLIIPFNMAYNYAVQNNYEAYMKQITYLGLNEDADDGVQINTAFIDKYLQNGSLEGFIRRYSVIYLYGISLDGFNNVGANDTVRVIVNNYMVPCEDNFFDSLKDTNGFYPNDNAYPMKSKGFTRGFYGDFAVETKDDKSYSFYYYKGTKIDKIPDFYHVLNNSDFSVGLSKDRKEKYSFYFLSDIAARYGKAVNLYDMSKYEEAQIIFEEIAGYADSDERLVSCKYNIALNNIQGQNYVMAYSLLTDVMAMRETEEIAGLLSEVKEKLYNQGLMYYEEQLYDTSNQIFELIIDYRDSRDRIHTHVYTETVISDSTCSHTGLLRKTCYCGKIVDEIIPYKDHDYDSYVAKEPTCSVEGERICTCKVCGHIYHDKIPTSPHDYAAASCTVPETCKVCGHEHGEPLGHSYSSSNVCDCCGYVFGENVRVIADCLPFDLERYLWGENNYIVSCSHKVVYNKPNNRMDLMINWTNSDLTVNGYGSLTYYLAASIYDQNGTLVKKDKYFYFNQGVATTYVYGISDNMDYYVELNLYIGSEKVK